MNMNAPHQNVSAIIVDEERKKERKNERTKHKHLLNSFDKYRCKFNFYVSNWVRSTRKINPSILAEEIGWFVIS